MQTMLAQGPPKRHLALCPKEQKGNMGATGRAGPPLPSHRVTCESGWVCSGFVCLKQAQVDVGHKPVGRVCPHPRGEWPGRDPESSGSAGCPC